jgi:hypothetical protein
VKQTKFEVNLKIVLVILASQVDGALFTVHELN